MASTRAHTRGEHGMVLIAMLVLAVLLAGTSLMLLDDGLRSRSEVAFTESGMQALAAAEAGLLRAEIEILSGVDVHGDGLGTVSGTVRNAAFEVTATDLGSGRYKLLAVGRENHARKRIEVGLRKRSGGLFNWAMFGKESVKLTGGSHTDAYDSDLGPWATQVTGTDGKGLLYAIPEGHVGSNGEIVLSGPVRGDAIPGPGFEVDHGEEAWGSTTPRTEDEILEDPPFADFQAAFLDNDNLTIDVSNPKVSYDADDMVLLGGGGAPITLNAGTYIFNTLKMTGGGNLIINGAVTIYITNYFEISGGGVANVSGLPADCVIYAHPYDFPAGSRHDKLYVKTSGGSDTALAVYAPTMHLEVSGGGTFYGALAGNTIVFSGGSAFHYDQALGRLGGGGDAGIEREYVRHIDD